MLISVKHVSCHVLLILYFYCLKKNRNQANHNLLTLYSFSQAMPGTKKNENKQEKDECSVHKK